MQRAKHHVAGFGGRDRRLHRLQVAELAHEDHVGILPQGPTECLGEARHVAADLPLVDRALLRAVVKLDRILDRDDVVVVVFVDEVDQRGERGALAGAGGPGDEKQATGPRDHLLADLGHAELLGREQLVGDLPQHHRHGAALLEHAHAKSGQILEGEAEVAAPLLGEFGLAPLGCDRLHEAVGVVGGEHLRGLRLHVAIHAKHRGQAGRDVDVADAVLHGSGEQFVDLDGADGSLWHGVGIAAARRFGLRRRGIVARDVEFERFVGGRGRPRRRLEHEHFGALYVEHRGRTVAERRGEREVGGITARREDGRDQRLHVVGTERCLADGPPLTVDQHPRRRADPQPNLGGGVVECDLEDLLDLLGVSGIANRGCHGSVPWRMRTPGEKPPLEHPPQVILF